MTSPTPTSGRARISSSPLAPRPKAVLLVFAAALSLALTGRPAPAAEDAPAKTLEQLRAAAKSGEPQALLDLADELAYGAEATAESQAESVAWFRRAAEKGSAEAQHHLGLLYWSGEGLEQDRNEAIRWFRRAAEQGNASAQFWLASAYEFGQGGLETDLAEAARWYRRAADQGQPEAQGSLGELYAEGRGVPRDEATAVSWFKKAADQNSPSGEYSLAEMYANGRGVPKDEKQAFLLYQKAADKDFTASMIALGEAYERGSGVTKDTVCAYFWYGFAAERGLSIGEEKRGALSPRLSDADRAEGDRLISGASVLDGVVQHPACPRDLISISVTHSPLSGLLKAFESISGLRILGVDETVAARSVTLKVDDVPWESALTQLLAGQGLRWQRNGGVIRVVRAEKNR